MKPTDISPEEWLGIMATVVLASIGLLLAVAAMLSPGGPSLN